MGGTLEAAVSVSSVLEYVLVVEGEVGTVSVSLLESVVVEGEVYII